MLNKGKYLNARRKKLLVTDRLPNKNIQLPISDLLGRKRWKWCLSSSTGQQGPSRQCCHGNGCALHPRTPSPQKSLSYLSWLLITTSGNTTMRQERLGFCSKSLTTNWLGKKKKKKPFKILKLPLINLFCVSRKEKTETLPLPQHRLRTHVWFWREGSFPLQCQLCTTSMSFPGSASHHRALPWARNAPCASRNAAGTPLLRVFSAHRRCMHTSHSFPSGTGREGAESLTQLVIALKFEPARPDTSSHTHLVSRGGN